MRVFRLRLKLLFDEANDQRTQQQGSHNGEMNNISNQTTSCVGLLFSGAWSSITLKFWRMSSLSHSIVTMLQTMILCSCNLLSIIGILWFSVLSFFPRSIIWYCTGKIIVKNESSFDQNLDLQLFIILFLPCRRCLTFITILYIKVFRCLSSYHFGL